MKKIGAKELLSVDTPLDRMFHRPPARALGRLLARLPIHPNHITLAGLIPAVLSALCFGRHHIAAGAAWFYVWAVLDHTDGELARATGKTSAFGQKLDDFCDSLGSNAILSGMMAGLMSLPNFWFPQLPATAAFIAAISLNQAAGARLLKIKRAKREEAVRTQIPAGFALEQKRMDLFTGRDPFYLLILVVGAALGFGGAWTAAATAAIIGGPYAVALGSAAAWIKMRGFSLDRTQNPSRSKNPFRLSRSSNDAGA